MNSAEHEGFCVGVSFRSLCQHEGVADKVGVFDYFIALVEVAEDADFLTEGGFGGYYAGVEFRVAGLLVLARYFPLAWGGQGDRIVDGGAGAVSGFFVDNPRVLFQGAIAASGGSVGYAVNFAFFSGGGIYHVINTGHFISSLLRFGIDTAARVDAWSPLLVFRCQSVALVRVLVGES